MQFARFFNSEKAFATLVPAAGATPNLGWCIGAKCMSIMFTHWDHGASVSVQAWTDGRREGGMDGWLDRWTAGWWVVAVRGWLYG